MLDNLRDHLRHGVCLSEQYAGKGTAMTCLAKIAETLYGEDFCSAPDMLDRGWAIEMKGSAQKAPGTTLTTT